MRSKKKKRSLFSLIYMMFAVSNPAILMAIGIAFTAVSAGMAIYQGYQAQKIANANARMKDLQAQRQQLAANRAAQLAANKKETEGWCYRCLCWFWC